MAHLFLRMRGVGGFRMIEQALQRDFQTTLRYRHLDDIRVLLLGFQRNPLYLAYRLQFLRFRRLPVLLLIALAAECNAPPSGAGARWFFRMLLWHLPKIDVENQHPDREECMCPLACHALSVPIRAATHVLVFCAAKIRRKWHTIK